MTQGRTDDCKEQTIDPFLGRMEEQCSRIRRYRRDILRREGRNLSRDEAALEWIERYAESFADKFAADHK